MRIRTMSIDFRLLILDPDSAAVVCERWLGGRDTLETAQEILARPPDSSGLGLECWSGVAPDDVRRIAEASYSGGGTSAEVATLSERFPTPRYIWMLISDY